ncbi:ComEC/Rec2 family competence protein [Vreelandella alkaliphila]|uniref:ComEC/Rec2 family competence protein n=1 Tax=Vreelandella alkaliphila TaxID=272774 RepID=UPI003FD71571
MGIAVRLLRANHGDCILVTHEGPNGAFNLLVDGGNSATFRHGPRGRFKGALCSTLDELKAKGQHIDLVILTHIDDDHIGGLLSAFKSPGYLREMVRSVWFNSSRTITNYFDAPEIPQNDIYLSDDSPDTSIRQGKALEALLDESGCDRASLIMAGQTIEEGPFTFTILSPDEKKLRQLLCIWPEDQSSPDTAGASRDYALSFEEIWETDTFEADTSIANGSSIAFILKSDDKVLLFLGDAHDETVVENLRSIGYSSEAKLTVDLVKVSHHGSQYNTSPEFLNLVDSGRYLISTDGSKHGLPNKRTIARILASNENGKICFNYGEIIGQVLLDHEVEAYSGNFETLGKEIRL